METLTTKINNLTIETLKEMAKDLMDDFRDGTELVHDLVMTALDNKMDEKEFISFCDSII